MSPDNIDICAAFDTLLPIPGLWGGMSIGSLNRVLALKCDEVSQSRFPRNSLNSFANYVGNCPLLAAREEILVNSGGR